MAARRPPGSRGRSVRTTRRGVPTGYIVGSAPGTGRTNQAAQLLSVAALADMLIATGKIPSSSSPALTPDLIDSEGNILDTDNLPIKVP